MQFVMTCGNKGQRSSSVLDREQEELTKESVSRLMVNDGRRRPMFSQKEYLKAVPVYVNWYF